MAPGVRLRADARHDACPTGGIMTQLTLRYLRRERLRSSRKAAVIAAVILAFLALFCCANADALAQAGAGHNGGMLLVAGMFVVIAAGVAASAWNGLADYRRISRGDFYVIEDTVVGKRAYNVNDRENGPECWLQGAGSGWWEISQLQLNTPKYDDYYQQTDYGDAMYVLCRNGAEGARRAIAVYPGRFYAPAPELERYVRRPAASIPARQVDAAVEAARQAEREAWERGNARPGPRFGIMALLGFVLGLAVIMLAILSMMH